MLHFLSTIIGYPYAVSLTAEQAGCCWKTADNKFMRGLYVDYELDDNMKTWLKSNNIMYATALDRLKILLFKKTDVFAFKARWL